MYGSASEVFQLLYVLAQQATGEEWPVAATIDPDAHDETTVDSSSRCSTAWSRRGVETTRRGSFACSDRNGPRGGRSKPSDVGMMCLHEPPK
jgi:hypothetical protein